MLMDEYNIDQLRKHEKYCLELVLVPYGLNLAEPKNEAKPNNAEFIVTEVQLIMTSFIFHTLYLKQTPVFFYPPSKKDKEITDNDFNRSIVWSNSVNFSLRNKGIVCFISVSVLLINFRYLSTT